MQNRRCNKRQRQRRRQVLDKIKFASWCGLSLLTYSFGLQIISSLRVIPFVGDRDVLGRPEAITVPRRIVDDQSSYKANVVQILGRPSPFFPTPKALATKQRSNPDFGGLAIASLRNASEFRRVLRDPLNDDYDQEQASHLATMDEDLVGEYLEIRDEWLSLSSIANRTFDRRQCRQNNWKHLMFPNCNTVHEISTNLNDRKVLGTGLSRMGWLIQEQSQPSFVLKQLLSLDKNRPVDAKNILRAQREALIMDRLSYSKRVVDTYGYCGTSNLVEAMSGGSMLHLVMPEVPTLQQKWKRILHETLPWIIPAPRMSPFNTVEKLEISLTVVESLAELHGFDGGVIFNTDLSLMQYLIGSQGEVKLNDFNAALIPGFDFQRNEYCKVTRWAWPNARYPPEQFFGTPLDEKVDLYALGDILCTILSGKWPVYEESREKPTRHTCDYTASNEIERRIEDLMERLWDFDPAERPSIFQVNLDLKSAKKLYEDSWIRSLQAVSRYIF